MAVGIEITLDPRNAVSGAKQVDAALDGIGDSAKEAQRQADAMIKALNKQKQSAEIAVSMAQATRSVAQEQSRLLAQQSRLGDSTATINKRQEEYQRLSGLIRQSVRDETSAKQQLVAINNTIARQPTSGGGVTPAITQTTTAMDSLVTAGKAFIALGVVSKLTEWGSAFIETADNINLLQSRINLYTRSQQETNAVFEQLRVVSNAAGVSLQDTAQTFTQFAAAGKDLGVSNQQVLSLVQNLQTMARVSGASGQAASSAIYQLSQAFASGRLQGDEFKSVSENLPVILDTLSKKLGVTRAELRQMATDGKLGAKEILTLTGSMEDLDAKAAALPRTVAQASAALTNNLGVAADAINDKLGLSQGVAKQIDAINQALDYWTKKLGGTSTETDELNRTLTTQRGGLIRLQETYDGIGDKTSRYALYLKEQIANQKATITETENQISSIRRLSNMANQLLGDMDAIRTGGTRERGNPEAAKAIKTLQEQTAYTKALDAANYELAASIKLGTQATKEQVTAYAAALKESQEYKQEKKDDTKAENEAAAAARRAAKELERNQEANQKYIKTLQDKVKAGDFDVQRAREQIALSMQQGASVEQLSAAYLKSIQVQNQLELQSKQAEAQSRLNKDATDAERAAVDAHVASLYRQQQAQQLSKQVQQIQTDTTMELNPVQGQLDAIAEQEAQRLAILDQARQQDLLNEQQYQDLKTQVQRTGEQQRNDIMTQNAAMLLSATGDLFGGLANILKNSKGEQSKIYKAMFLASKAFAIAQAGVLLWQNVSKAMSVGFPANIPFIAAAFAQGTSILQSLSGIQATGFANGGMVRGAGSGTSDSISARLSNGEYLMPARQTRMYQSELAAMRSGSYSGGSDRQTNISVANYGNDRVQVQQLTADDVRLIIGEEFPSQSAREWGNAYSQTNRAFRNTYNASRNTTR